MDENRYPQDNNQTPASGFDAYPARERKYLFGLLKSVQ